MSVTTPKSDGERILDIGDWMFSLPLEQKLRSEVETCRRALDREAIFEALEHGERYQDRAKESNCLIVHTEAGIKFHVIADVAQREVVTAYPVDCDRFDAATSNRWTRPILEDIEQRIKEGNIERQRHLE